MMLIASSFSQRLCFVLLLGLFVVAACNQRTTDDAFDANIEAQQRYFPLQLGKAVEYQVDSIVFDPASTGGTAQLASTTWVREVASDTLRDNAGALRWVIERFERKSDTLPWVLARIWSASLNQQQAIRQEENLTYLRIIFPMDRRSEWDGHVFLDQNMEIRVADETMRPFVNWRYEVDSIDVPGRIGGFTFDSLLMITEVDETNIIERRWSTSTYAKGVGLVYREQWILDSQYCNSSPVPADCETRPWEQKAERGYILRMKIVSF
jgi:hypothetical protein